MTFWLVLFALIAWLWWPAHVIAGASVTLLVQMLAGASVAVCIGRYMRREV